jgi:hypothetical protein
MKAALPAAALMLALAACRPETPQTPSAFGFTVEGQPTAASLAQLTATTGIPPRLVVFFLAWPKPGEPFAFPAESLRAIADAGAIPVLTWEPWTLGGAHPQVVPAADILDGRYDAGLAAFAAAARDFQRPIWIRFAHEMNFDHYHWGVSAKDYGPEAPFLYRDLFRHVVDVFRAQRATNVRWVFCPNAESIPNPDRGFAASWNRASRYYPGDDYVDVLGMDGYNWGDTLRSTDGSWRSHWQSFEEIFTSLHAELRRTAPTKPVVVFETASVATGGDKAAWIASALRTAARWQLEAVCWFQVNKETDWRLETGLTADALHAIAAEANSGRALH